MENFVKLISKANSLLNNFVWGPPMLVFLVGTGLLITIRINFISIKKIGYVLKNTLFKMFSKDDKGEGEVSSFEAVATALAATVGTGNIAGVATAIASGGPGAVFWMWIAAIVGMATKFAEVVLSVNYREKTEDGRFLGGPMYYIKKGLNGSGFAKILAVLFAIFGSLAAFGIGDMVQSNSISSALKVTFGFDPLIVGIIVAILAGAVLIGGIKRIGQVTSMLVPFMAAFYIIGALIIIAINIKEIPSSFALIFRSAFNGQAAFGGFLGAGVSQAIRFGIARGVFTNEAGLGSSPIAHAAASTDHPVRQGLWGIFEVFTDTIVICSVTALAIISTGSWHSAVDSAGETLSGAPLTIAAFTNGLPGDWGGPMVSIGLVLFAFSTILGWQYYGERCAEYIFGEKIIFPYKIIYLALTVIGATVELELLWGIADTLNGLMAIPNLIGIVALSGIVVKLTKEFFNDEKLSGIKRK